MALSAFSPASWACVSSPPWLYPCSGCGWSMSFRLETTFCLGERSRLSLGNFFFFQFKHNLNKSITCVHLEIGSLNLEAWERWRRDGQQRVYGDTNHRQFDKEGRGWQNPGESLGPARAGTHSCVCGFKPLASWLCNSTWRVGLLCNEIISVSLSFLWDCIALKAGTWWLFHLHPMFYIPIHENCIVFASFLGRPNKVK